MKQAKIVDMAEVKRRKMIAQYIAFYGYQRKDVRKT